MNKVILILFLSLLPVIGSADNIDSSRQNKTSSTQVDDHHQQSNLDTRSLNSLLEGMNRNNEQTIQLLDKIVSEGCSQQLQVDTIKLVANMNRNIQIMTNIMMRMGYNIEELSRAPKKMNDLPFMP